jgi:hypothetical protein
MVPADKLPDRADEGRGCGSLRMRRLGTQYVPDATLPRRAERWAGTARGEALATLVGVEAAFVVAAGTEHTRVT